MTSDLLLILDDMHAAILVGDFGRLAQLSLTLDSARREVEDFGHPAPELIQAKAQRNAICLQAAILGVKSAQRRVADIAQAARGLTTYDRGGVKATLIAHPAQSRRV